jgi:tripartite-type tricarboxylate transporter receptor subunit TctC
VAGASFIVPFGREGAADRAARAFAVALAGGVPGREPGIENVPGAGGLKGVQRANELAAAGHAVLLLGTPSTHILLPARLGAAAAPAAAFDAVLGLGAAPNVLLVSPRLGVRSVAELIARARAEALVYASAGEGQTIHVCTALFCEQAGIAMTHRPYDAGSVNAYGDLTAGRVHVYFDNLLGCRDRIAAGDAVPLAVSSLRRSPLLPAVATLAELGFPDHALDVWLGVFGANLDAETVAGAAAARGDAVHAAELRAQGLDGGPAGADELAQAVARSMPAWSRALRAA